jgi:hypothetical protein
MMLRKLMIIVQNNLHCKVFHENKPATTKRISLEELNRIINVKQCTKDTNWHEG